MNNKEDLSKSSMIIRADIILLSKIYEIVLIIRLNWVLIGGCSLFCFNFSNSNVFYSISFTFLIYNRGKLLLLTDFV